MPISFAQVRKNAAEQNVHESEITVLYDDLSQDEIEKLTRAGVITQDLGSGKALGRLPGEQYDYLQEKATGVLKLSAD